MSLAGEKDLVAAFAEGGAVVIHALFVSGGRIKVVDAEIEGSVNHLDRVVHPALTAKDALAAQAK